MENQILLEKIGESKTQKLLDDCNKIYMEKFNKVYPNYYENHFIKSISKVLVMPPNSNEILGIGMSCMNDLLTKQFAQWLGGFIGSTDQTDGDPMKTTSGATVSTFGRSHGGSSFSHWGNTNSGGSRGLTMNVGDGIDVPTKDDFSNPTNQGNSLSLTPNAGSFNSGLGTVDWTATASAGTNFNISNSFVVGRWSASGQGAISFLIVSDLISPVVPVTIGQSVFLDITMVFN